MHKYLDFDHFINENNEALFSIRAEYFDKATVDAMRVAFEASREQILINLIRQSNKTNCGQACVAMLLGVSLKEAERLIGHNGITKPDELWLVLKDRYPKGYNSEVYGRIKSLQSKLYLCLHKNPKNSDQKHWTICYQGNIIDPSGRQEKDLWPMEKHWILS